MNKFLEATKNYSEPLKSFEVYTDNHNPIKIKAHVINHVDKCHYRFYEAKFVFRPHLLYLSELTEETREALGLKIVKDKYIEMPDEEHTKIWRYLLSSYDSEMGDKKDGIQWYRVKKDRFTKTLKEKIDLKKCIKTERERRVSYIDFEFTFDQISKINNEDLGRFFLDVKLGKILYEGEDIRFVKYSTEPFYMFDSFCETVFTYYEEGRLKYDTYNNPINLPYGEQQKLQREGENNES